MNLSTLKSLQSRIREATGADRELDLEIAQLFRPNGEWSLTYQPRLPSLYTTDPDGLGACVGLINTVLPGALWSVWDMEHGPGARLLCPGKSGAFHDGRYAEVDHLSDWTPASVCHALVDCVVSALIAAKEKADV